jgi:hypothetical protein
VKPPPAPAPGGRRAACVALGAVLAGPLAAVPAARAAAAVHRLAPGGSLVQALREASDGDIIELAAGAYHGEVAVIAHKRLTLRGVGGRAVLHAAGRDAEGKAILVVRDGDIRIENIEFRGTRVPDGNGAGIRFERGRLVVRRCAFFDNQNGILTANFADAELVVEDSEFGQAPSPDHALPHLLYVGQIRRFTLRGSRLGGGNQGHLVKSRARENHLHYNHLVDGSGGRASYELEFPHGGLAFVIGNVIGQSRTTRNPTLLAFGAEGYDEREQGLFMAHNTLVNAALRPARFVHVHDPARPVPTRLVNNLCVGPGVADAVLANALQGNFMAPTRALRDAAAGLYTLAMGSLLRHRGVEPGAVHGVSLRPVAEFSAPVGTRPLQPAAHWSPGAYQA